EVSNEVTEVEQTTEEAVAEAEAMLAKINAVAPDAPMLPASEPTVEDVARAVLCPPPQDAPYVFYNLNRCQHLWRAAEQIPCHTPYVERSMGVTTTGTRL